MSWRGVWTVAEFAALLLLGAIVVLSAIEGEDARPTMAVLWGCVIYAHLKAREDT